MNQLQSKGYTRRTEEAQHVPFLLQDMLCDPSSGEGLSLARHGTECTGSVFFAELSMASPACSLCLHSPADAVSSELVSETSLAVIQP